MKLKSTFLVLSLCGNLQACSAERTDVAENNPDKIPDNVEFKEAIIDFNGHFLTALYDSIGSHIYDGQFDAEQKIRVGPTTGHDAATFKLDSNGKVIRKSFSFDSTNWTSSYTYNNVDLRTQNLHILNTNPSLKAKLSKENNKYGFVNSKDQWIIPPQWDFVQGFQSNPPASFVWNYAHPYSRWGGNRSKRPLFTQTNLCNSKFF